MISLIKPCCPVVTWWFLKAIQAGSRIEKFNQLQNFCKVTGVCAKINQLKHIRMPFNSKNKPALIEVTVSSYIVIVLGLLYTETALKIAFKYDA